MQMDIRRQTWLHIFARRVLAVKDTPVDFTTVKVIGFENEGNYNDNFALNGTLDIERFLCGRRKWNHDGSVYGSFGYAGVIFTWWGNKVCDN